jgi:hypothetical protein
MIVTSRHTGHVEFHTKSIRKYEAYTLIWLENGSYCVYGMNWKRAYAKWTTD